MALSMENGQVGQQSRTHKATAWYAAMGKTVMRVFLFTPSSTQDTFNAQVLLTLTHLSKRETLTRLLTGRL